MAGIKATIVRIDAQRAGQRVDNYLFAHFSNIPKSRIYRAIRSGEVRVNKKRVKPPYRLQTGDYLRIPPINDSTTTPFPPVPIAKCHQLEEQILFEDDHVLVINKPAGLATHRGSGDIHGVIEIMRASRVHQPYLELAHRIDKATSGCLVLAKSRRCLLDIHNALRSKDTLKHYTCLVKGNWNVKEYVVQHRLQKRSHEQTGAKINVDESGKIAKTTFTTSQLFSGSSLMNAQIHTGRTHQIRVHAQEEGHPIAGDVRYGDFSFNRELQSLGLRRMFLHASYIGMQLVELNRKYEFQAPLPEELKQLCEQL